MPRPQRPMAATMIVEPPNGAASTKGEDLQGTLTLLTDPSPGALIAIDNDELIVGRSPEVNLSIDDVGLSRAHARFFRQGGSYYVDDLQSTNGTSVNGHRISGPTHLVDGSRIQLGKSTILRFALQDQLEQETARKLYEQSVRDALTGLHNRRYMEDRLAGEFAYACRYQTDLAVILLDVDHFKAINDHHGHQAGDAVLRGLGQRLQHLVALENVIARYGGEEFLIASRSVNPKGAIALAERIRRAIWSEPLRCGSTAIPVTVSAGVAAMVNNCYSHPSALVAAADRALYQAKNQGRNQVVFAQEPCPSAPAH